MPQDIFNNYNENGHRQTITGSRSSRTADNALLYNLKFRWQKELAKYNDVQIVNAYDEFAISEDFGNNDEKFLDWINSMYGE